METLSIGQVARQVGVGVQTIRYYEKEGLLPEPSRRPSGYREYPREVVRRLGFISRAKALGFTLGEIRELLSLRVDPTSTCADVRQRTRERLADVEARIAALERLRVALQALWEACSGTGPTSECPILEALDSESRKSGWELNP